MKTRNLTNVPEDKVKEIKSDFESEGCTVQVYLQANGKFSVIATCPLSAATKQILQKVR